MLEWLEAYQLPCLFKGVFGVNCPVCGFQRAFYLLLRGQLWASICTWSALIPLLLFILLAAARILGVKKISMKLLKNIGFACFAIILISYLFRFIINTL